MHKLLASLYDDAFGGRRSLSAIKGIAGRVVVIGCRGDGGDACGLADGALIRPAVFRGLQYECACRAAALAVGGH